MRLRRLAITSISALALAVAGCGDDTGSGQRGDSAIDGDPSTPLPAELTKTPVEKKGKPFDKTKLAKISPDLAKKPSVPKPAGLEAPDDLVVVDVVPGTGAEAKAGSKVSVQYVGVTFSAGKQFDASWDRKKPFDFTLGQGAVIKGWDEGVKGMKVGGRRELVIPADQAYGAQGSPPNIGPNEALIFVIDLKKVSKGK